MIPEITNISLMHYSCLGLYAPRDKYILDRSIAEGYLRIEIDENLLPTCSFTQYSNNEQPSESNIESALLHLQFYMRRNATNFLWHIDFVARHTYKKSLTEITAVEVKDALQDYYNDSRDRKGSIYFENKYIEVLINSADKVAAYLNKGGSVNVL